MNTCFKIDGCLNKAQSRQFKQIVIRSRANPIRAISSFRKTNLLFKTNLKVSYFIKSDYCNVIIFIEEQTEQKLKANLVSLQD